MVIKTRCPVCDEELEAPNVADCNWCGRRFHLKVRTDIEGKDCGQVWINERELHLEFACRLCVEDGLDDDVEVDEDEE